jgi:hypothetical protein
MADVRDIDRGWQTAFKSIVKAEGLVVKVGYLSGVPKYPKKEGGSPVVKVAAVHGMIKVLANAFDGMRGEINKRVDLAHGDIIKGRDPGEALHDHVGLSIRQRYRFSVAETITPRSGRLQAAIRATVFDGSKVVAGDNPRRPRASDRPGGTV